MYACMRMYIYVCVHVNYSVSTCLSKTLTGTEPEILLWFHIFLIRQTVIPMAMVVPVVYCASTIDQVNSRNLLCCLSVSLTLLSILIALHILRELLMSDHICSFAVHLVSHVYTFVSHIHLCVHWVCQLSWLFLSREQRLNWVAEYETRLLHMGRPLAIILG